MKLKKWAVHRYKSLFSISLGRKKELKQVKVKNLRESIRTEKTNMYERFSLLESTRLSAYGLKPTLWRLFSTIGHKLFRLYPPQKLTESGLKLLNLGAGSDRTSDLVNADFYRLHKLFSSTRADWMLDITKPMKCDNEYWDGVYLSHVNEHLTYTENYKMLSELYRTMKSGAVIRIVAPDLDRYLKWSDLRNVEKKMMRYQSLPEAISNLAQNHSHVSVWNAELMVDLLEELGFKNIRFAEFNDSKLHEFEDLQNHKWQSFYVEGER